MSAATLDLAARYSVAGYGGIAFYLLGPAQDEMEPAPFLVCEDGAPDHDHEDDCWLWPDEAEVVDSETMVRAVMVGDDREHIVDVDDLTVIAEDDYCSECGQIGCTADGR
jgi:hypothetical protein